MKKQILLLAAGLLCAACTKEMAPDDNVSGDRFVLRASLEQDKSDGKTDSGEEGEKTTLIVNTSVMQGDNVPSERCLFLGGSAKTTEDAQDSTIFANNIFYHHFSQNPSMNCYSIRTQVHRHNTDPDSTYPYGDAYIKSYGHN